MGKSMRCVERRRSGRQGECVGKKKADLSCLLGEQPMGQHGAHSFPDISLPNPLRLVPQARCCPSREQACLECPQGPASKSSGQAKEQTHWTCLPF